MTDQLQILSSGERSAVDSVHGQPPSANDFEQRLSGANADGQSPGQGALNTATMFLYGLPEDIDAATRERLEQWLPLVVRDGAPPPADNQTAQDVIDLARAMGYTGESYEDWDLGFAVRFSVQGAVEFLRDRYAEDQRLSAAAIPPDAFDIYLVGRNEEVDREAIANADEFSDAFRAQERDIVNSLPQRRAEFAAAGFAELDGFLPALLTGDGELPADSDQLNLLMEYAQEIGFTPVPPPPADMGGDMENGYDQWRASAQAYNNLTLEQQAELALEYLREGRFAQRTLVAPPESAAQARLVFTDGFLSAVTEWGAEHGLIDGSDLESTIEVVMAFGEAMAAGGDSEAQAAALDRFEADVAALLQNHGLSEDRIHAVMQYATQASAPEQVGARMVQAVLALIAKDRGGLPPMTLTLWADSLNEISPELTRELAMRGLLRDVDDGRMVQVLDTLGKPGHHEIRLTSQTSLHFGIGADGQQIVQVEKKGQIVIDVIMAVLAFTPAAPLAYAYQAAKAVEAASDGNWRGAVMSGLSAMGGFAKLANANAMANATAAASAGDSLALTHAVQAADTAEGIATVATVGSGAARVVAGIEDDNLATALSGGLSIAGVNQPQANVANVILNTGVAIDDGDAASAISNLASLSPSDAANAIGAVADGVRMVDALESGNGRAAGNVLGQYASMGYDWIYAAEDNNDHAGAAPSSTPGDRFDYEGQDSTFTGERIDVAGIDGFSGLFDAEGHGAGNRPANTTNNQPVEQLTPLSADEESFGTDDMWAWSPVPSNQTGDDSVSIDDPWDFLDSPPPVVDQPTSGAPVVDSPFDSPQPLSVDHMLDGSTVGDDPWDYLDTPPPMGGTISPSGTYPVSNSTDDDPWDYLDTPPPMDQTSTPPGTSPVNGSAGDDPWDYLDTPPLVVPHTDARNEPLSSTPASSEPSDMQRHTTNAMIAATSATIQSGARHAAEGNLHSADGIDAQSRDVRRGSELFAERGHTRASDVFTARAGQLDDLAIDARAGAEWYRAVGHAAGVAGDVSGLAIESVRAFFGAPEGQSWDQTLEDLVISFGNNVDDAIIQAGASVAWPLRWGGTIFGLGTYEMYYQSEYNQTRDAHVERAVRGTADTVRDVWNYFVDTQGASSEYRIPISTPP